MHLEEKYYSIKSCKYLVPLNSYYFKFVKIQRDKLHVRFWHIKEISTSGTSFAAFVPVVVVISLSLSWVSFW